MRSGAFATAAQTLVCCCFRIVCFIRLESCETVRRLKRPEREAIFGLFVGEGVEKRRRWDAIDRAAENIESRIDAIAADCEPRDLKRGEQAVAGKTAVGTQAVADEKIDQLALGGLKRRERRVWRWAARLPVQAVAADQVEGDTVFFGERDRAGEIGAHRKPSPP